MKILLYCIFTNEYKRLIPLWLKYTARNFYPGNTDILIITDDADVEKAYPGVMVRVISSSKYRNEELLAKLKRHCDILDEYKEAGYDLFAYIQANCLVPVQLNHDNFPLYEDKITCATHVTYPDCSNVLKASVACKGSVAYRDISLYNNVYVHAGIAIGGYSVLKEMNFACLQMQVEDTARGELHKAKYHDETYFNTWRVDNPDRVHLVHEIDHGELNNIHDSTKLLYLVDKSEVEIGSSELVAPSFPAGARLGNMLFTFAAAYAHAKRNKYSFVCPYIKGPLSEILGTKFSNSCDYVGKPYKETSYDYTPIPNTAKGWIHGYFQSSKYFSDCEDDIREIYNVLCPGEKIKNTAAIHIRLGDYVTLNSIWKSPSKDFIDEALSRLSSNITTLNVYSDELDRALGILYMCPNSARFKVVPRMCNEITAIREMAESEEFIMSCSSFSWWAAYLGKHKNVFVERKWYTDKSDLSEKDIYEPSWIKI